MTRREIKLNKLFRCVLGIAREKDDGGVLYGTMREDELDDCEREFRALIRRKKWDGQRAVDRKAL